MEFNILVLLSDFNVDHPDEIFDFFIEHKIKYLQFVQCVEPDGETGKVTDFSITPEQYGKFLCRIFDRWVEHGTDKISVRTFDSLLSYCLGQGQTECTFRSKCSDYIVVEHNGDIFCCDFFVEKQWCLGNIMETSIDKLASSKMKRDFSRQKQNITNKCLVCRHLDVCRGGCMKDRNAYGTGFNNESYFCESYRMFFDHALPKMWDIAANFQQQNPA